MIYLLALPMTLLGALGAYFFKKTTIKENKILTIFGCKEFYLGGFFYVSGAALNILLLRYLQYSIIYPMTAITYVWTAILSRKLLGEDISKRTLCGILLICVGVMFLAK